MQLDIQVLLTPTLQALGYELWGVEYLSRGNASLLRVYIDKTGGITIDDCEQASRQISALLDVEDPFPNAYFLEVSSPGIPRRLFYKEQYLRYLGETLRLKLYQQLNGQKKINAKLKAVEQDTLTFEAQDGVIFMLSFSEIVKAELIDK